VKDVIVRSVYPEMYITRRQGESFAVENVLSNTGSEGICRKKISKMRFGRRPIELSMS
jgi:hypothetical protein